MHVEYHALLDLMLSCMLQGRLDEILLHSTLLNEICCVVGDTSCCIENCIA